MLPKMILLVATFIGAAYGRVSYEGYTVFRVTPKTQLQLDYLKSLEFEQVDFWQECTAIGRHCDIMMSPESQTLFTGHLANLGIETKILMQDVESLANTGVAPDNQGRISWDAYYGLNDIHAFLEEQSAVHSQIAEVITIGQSHEGRDMKLIKIARANESRPVIFVEANIHAREWITNAVGTFLIHDLLNNLNPEKQKWTEDFEWYILPVTNVDGYEYTRSTDRMWRKNRNTTPSPTCRGIDLNRNFDYNWGGPGSSHQPCQETYCGTGPNSEIETQNVVAFVEPMKDDIVMYLAVHSYSQYIMFSYADRVDESFYDSHMDIATQAAAALQATHGTVFTPGNWLDILYISTGDSMDWAKEKLNVSLSYTYELRDEGRYGFLLPPEQIMASAEEFMASLQPIVDALRNMQR